MYIWRVKVQGEPNNIIIIEMSLILLLTDNYKLLLIFITIHLIITIHILIVITIVLVTSSRSSSSTYSTNSKYMYSNNKYKNNLVI